MLRIDLCVRHSGVRADNRGSGLFCQFCCLSFPSPLMTQSLIAQLSGCCFNPHFHPFALSYSVTERCKHLPERPRNGLVIAPKTTHGMKAVYKCRDGFTLVGRNITTCMFGKWTEATPVCQESECTPFLTLIISASTGRDNS